MTVPGSATITTPYRDLMPPLATQEMESLRASIEVEGVREVCLATEDGRLLDGHNRLAICPEATVAYIPGSAAWTDEECQAFIYRKSRGRRNLSPAQKQEIRQQEIETARKLREQDPVRFTQPVIAKMLGIAQQTVSSWLTSNTSDGSSCENEPDAKVKVPSSCHATILDRIETGESQRQIAADYGVTQQAISYIVAKANKASRVQEGIATKGGGCTVDDLAKLSGLGQKFGTIYADPPWSYGNQGTRASTDKHYVTMTVDAIASLPVADLAADYCHLHLWTTNAFLFECPRLMDAWGFKYQGVFVWCKPQMGIGNCYRVSHEFLLLGIKGEPRTFPVHNIKSYDVVKRGKHSAKPEKFRRMIETVSPGPRLEMFGRAAVENWTVWGNEIGRDLFTQDTETL